MALIKCSECGADISEKASICPKCGCPADVSIEFIKNKKKHRQKKIVIGIISVFAIVIICLSIYKFITRPDTSGYFNDFKWGMTYDEVKKQLGDGAIYNDEKKSVTVTYEDYEGKTGINVIGGFEFEDNSLKRISLFISNGDGSEYTDEALVDEYVKQFDKTYGKHEKEAISYIWNTKKSRIEFTYLSDNLLALTYEEIGKD